MKNLRIIKWLLAGCGLLAGFFLLLFLIITASLYLTYSNGSLQKWLSAQLHASVTFDVAGVTWIGTHPTLEFRNIVVMSDNTPLPTLKVDQGLIKFDLWQSLMHFKPVTSSILLDNLHMRFIQDAAGHYYLQGATPGASQISWQDVWQWLSLQRNIQLVNAFISLHRNDNTVINLTALNLDWLQRDADLYQLAVDFNLPEASGHFKMQAELAGNLAKFDTFSANVHGELASQDIPALVEDLHIQNLQLSRGTGAVELWGQWRNGNLLQVQAKTDLHDILVHNTATQSDLHVKKLMENLIWKNGGDNSWQLVIAPINRADEDNYFSLTSKLLPDQTTHINFQFASLKLPLLSHLLQIMPNIPVSLQNSLSHLDPRGSLHDGFLNLDIANGKIKNYVLDFTVNNLSLDAWQNWPTIQGLDMDLHMTPNWGTALINSKDLSVDDSPLFPGAWPNMQVNADIRWLLDSDHLQVKLANLQVVNPWLDFSAAGSYLAPAQELNHGHLRLVAGLQAQNLQQILPLYLPLQHMDQALRTWLASNIIDAPHESASLVVDGQLQNWPFKTKPGRFELLAKVQDLGLTPWKSWPEITGIDGELLFNNHQFIAKATQGYTLGGRVYDATVKVDDLSPKTPSALVVNGYADASGAQAENYITHSPLNKELGSLLHYISVDGPMNLKLTLTYPLAQSGKPHTFKGIVKFKDDSVQLQNTTLMAEHLNGEVEFANDWLNSQNLAAKLLDQPLSIIMRTLTSPNSNVKTQVVAVKTSIDMSAFTKQWPGSLAQAFSGIVPVTVTFKTQKNKQALALTADLTPLAVNLPAPLAKPAGQTLPLSVRTLNLKQGQDWPVIVHMGPMMDAKLLLQNKDQQFVLSKGVVSLGGAKMPAMPNSGVFIQGNIAYLSIVDWLNYYDQLKASNPATKSQQPVKLNDNWWQQLPDMQLLIGNLIVFTQSFTGMTLDLTKVSDHLQLKVNSPQIAGTIQVPVNSSQALQANLDYWYISLPKQSGSNKVTAKQAAQIPPLAISVQNFFIDNGALGAVNLTTQPEANGMDITNLSINNPNLSAKLSGRLWHEALHDWSSINSSIDAKNLGAALQQLGYTNLMTGGQGTINIDLSWQGILLSPDVSTLVGNIDFNLTKGSLSEVNPGFGRILGLLNVGSWLRRIELNFTDITDKGLAFDTLSGSYKFSNGIASTAGVDLSGPAMSMTMNGNVNLINNTIDQTIVVMPHTSGSLGLIAGVIGGPIVGVATWLADSVLSNTVLKGKGITYSVTGPISKPEVNLVQ